ncbi:MAG: hypothetical protein KA375_04450 [Vitreoscilla sp.]|nr:hypothetical protein [Vitreoscilla sp.]MBP6674079.1 hypothetical protein [Vitreoscilla sp.]
MHAPRTLSGFLVEVHQRHPAAALVLGLEGHGSGYLPELDTRRLSWEAANKGRDWIWHISATEAAPMVASHLTEGGLPALTEAFPTCPGGNPAIPVNQQPLSTYGLGWALRDARLRGCPKLSVIHFDNCFNLSTEVLHTVAPYADAADGFANYTFFTAGEAYALAFEQLGAQGQYSSLALAKQLSLATHELLKKPGDGYPAVGGALALNRMEGIADGIEALSDALILLMQRDGNAARDLIQAAIVKAQNYDTDFPQELETPDQLTDIYSLANALLDFAAKDLGVVTAAKALCGLLNEVRVFGDVGHPAMAPQFEWNFAETTLAMNIFLPDPLRRGQWDWRTPYYGDVRPEPFKITLANGSTQVLPPAQTGVIDFLTKTTWVDFLKVYHADTHFVSFHVGAVPDLPHYDPHYVPPKDGQGGNGTQGGGGRGCPSQRGPRLLGPLGDWLAQLRDKLK